MSETTSAPAPTTIRQRVRPQGERVLPNLALAKEEDPEVRRLKDYSGRRQMEDPFKDSYQATLDGILSIIEPPYSFYSLMRLPQENSVLGQCIDAMITNIVGHGWRLEYVGEDENETTPAAEREKSVLEGLLNFPNDETTLQEALDRFWRDYENLGFACLEVGRDKQQRVTMVSHIPGHTMRMTRRDNVQTDVEVLLPRDGKLIKQKVKKRFRRFVQMNGSKRIYFKEFGDPRVIDPNNGVVNEALPMEESATEIIVHSRYNPGSPYGLPRWFNQLPAIMGTRQSELTNLDFFSENAIPALALLVSGGMVTQNSIDAIEAHFTAARGRKSMNRVLILEASGDERLAAPDGGVPIPKVEMKPLQSERQGDALFQNYESNNRDKVRSSFRLPPIFIGLAHDYTYATAKTSQEVAETQVFTPERQQIESLINLKILSTWNPQFWAFRLNPPRITDPDGVVKALEVFDKMGGLTPNIAISLANQFFDLDIPAIEEDWGDYPFAIVGELVKQGKISFEDIENTDPLEHTLTLEQQFAPPEPKPVAGAKPAQKQDVPEPVAQAREALLALRSVMLATSSATRHAVKGDKMPVAVRQRRHIRSRKRPQPSYRKVAA